jgi:hypothetical protein
MPSFSSTSIYFGFVWLATAHTYGSQVPIEAFVTLLRRTIDPHTLFANVRPRSRQRTRMHAHTGVSSHACILTSSGTNTHARRL